MMNDSYLQMHSQTQQLVINLTDKLEKKSYSRGTAK